MPRLHLLPSCTALVLLAGCAATPLRIPDPIALPARTDAAADAAGADERLSAGAGELTPQVPSHTPATREPSAARPDPARETATLEINVDQLALPVFAQMVFGEMLRTSVQIDPKVAERKDLVSFRTGASQTPSQLRELAAMLLKSYGVAVVDLGNVVRVLPDGGSLGYLPEIRRGAALPDSPAALRPQFHLIDLTAVRNTDVASWIRNMFGERVRMQEDPVRNALLLSGTPDNLAAAMEAIRVLDQPVMQGRRSGRISPRFASVDDLARRLFDVLTAEGYAVQPLGTNATGGIRFPIILLPVSAINAILVFANSETVVGHVQRWAGTLDQPNNSGVGRNLFTYQVRHKDASVLATTLEQLLGGRPAAAATAGGQPAAPAAAGRGAVVVDKSTNTLIFQGPAEDYSQIRSLLATLDRPSRAALIEVTVAEVQLTENMQFGVEWALRGDTSGGDRFTAGTLGGLSIGSSGFTYRLVDSASQVRAIVNALASDNRATVLSSPRVLARNGETATIQVGQEVPIVTSQQGSLTGTGNVPATGVLQTIQYRNTGVILRVKPVIHSGDQIDLDVVQEVSSAETTTTGVNVSPTFGTRKVETKLTLRNGSTVMLAGLIQNRGSTGNAGIPGIKDIPLIGNLFRTDTQTSQRTELIVLITPYVLNDDHDARAVTEAFRGMLGDWAAPGASGTTPRLPAPAPAPAPALQAPGNERPR